MNVRFGPFGMTACAYLALSLVAQAQFNYTTNSDNTLTITGYTGGIGSIDIPSSINGKTVTVIKDQAFMYNAVLTRVTIPNTVTNIKYEAFRGCSSLTNITIGSGVSSMGSQVFWSCTNLNSVVISNGVTSIGASAFGYCTRLPSIVIPDSVTNIQGSAFQDCNKLTNAVIGNGVKSIGDWAFFRCTRLPNIEIGSGVNNIGDWAFDNCSSLTSITVNASNASYSSTNGVLFNKNKATLFRYPEGKGGSYVVPTGVTSIRYSSFFNCTNLTGVAIGGVTNIGAGAFSGCTSMATLAISNSITPIGSNAFDGCRTLTDVMIGNGVTRVGPFAFRNCTRMGSVTIPGSVASLDDNAFQFCGGLANVLISNGVANIGLGAFSYCTNLSSVVIGNGATNIGQSVFYECTRLSNIVIPDSVRSIGNYAFRYCNNLLSTTIGSGVTSIGHQAFEGCSRLSGVYFRGNAPPNVGTGIFTDAINVIVYYIFGTAGWPTVPDTWFGRPTALWNAESLSINPTSTNFSSTATTGRTIGVSANVAWTAASNVSWIAITGGASGSGNGTVTFSVATNPATSSRTGGVIVASGGLTRTCTVTQAGAAFSLAISPTSTNFTSAAANGKIIGVMANISWTATTNMPWISVTAGSSGTSNGTVTFSVATNSATSRTGGIIIAGSGISLTCTVVQAGITAPAAPTGVSASDGTFTNQVQVSWSASSGATGYVVLRFTNSNPNLASNIARGIANSPYNDTNVTAGRVYYYWLRATNAAGASALSSSNSGYAQLAPPSAPTGVAATKGSFTNKVRVTWSASSGATGYEVWRHTSNNSNSASRIAQGLGGSPYDDPTVAVGTNYYYWLKASNAGGASALSLSDSGYASNAIPSAPTGVSASDGTYSDRIRVIWTNSPEATGYEVWRNTNNVSGSATIIGQNIVGSPYDDSTVAQGVTNYYWLKATNSSGTSAFSSSDWGLRALTSYGIAGAVIYGGSQTGMVRIMASPIYAGQNSLALSLDGIDDSVSFETPTASLQLGNQMTICAWINVMGIINGTSAAIVNKASNNPTQLSYEFSILKSTGNPYFNSGDTRRFYGGHIVSSTSGWTHLAFTHDGTVGIWYVNGQFSSLTTNPPIQRYGNGPFNIGNLFPGQLDDIGLWTRTLSPGEIQSEMTNGMAGAEAKLAGFWDFNDGTATDRSTNANHGVFRNGATTVTGRVTTVHNEYSTSVPSPSGYAISNVPAGEYTVWAYRDSSGNGSQDPWEACGSYPANSLCVTGNMATIDITLQDPISDSDGDGVTDYDEVYVYGTLWNNPDSDDDGMYDGDEVLAGSSPTNGESMFGFADSQPVPEGGGVVISWPSLSNRVYRLERTTNLLMDFEPLATDIPADPPVNSWTDDTPNVIGVYKVGVRME